MAEVKAKVPRKKRRKDRKRLVCRICLDRTGHNWFAGVLYLAVYPELLV